MMRPAIFLFAALLLCVLPAHAHAQDAEHIARAQSVAPFPAKWVALAHDAFERFRRGHRRDVGCFDAMIEQTEDGVIVSFEPHATETIDTDPASRDARLTISRPTTCGFGESFQFDGQGHLTRRWYLRD